jgi:hypothetical protein
MTVPLKKRCPPIQELKGHLDDNCKTQTGWWIGTFFICPYIGNVKIPTDELIFFRGVG